MTPTDSTAIVSFTIDIADEALVDLRARLAATRSPDPLPGDDWSTGVPSERLHALADAWARFDWRAFEAKVNRTPQFTTDIDGQRIHFVHVISPVEDAMPLLLTHGWPGSFLEFLDLIGPLTDPVAFGGRAEDAFDVVIPSLPGFGFSSPLTTGGWTTSRIASAWVELMDRLGYERFAVQGGDIGASVAPEIARVAPDRVVGVHVNGGLGFAGQVDDATWDDLMPVERDRVTRVRQFMQDEFGYIAVQSTRPGLIGAALTDSAVGQLAWMADKLTAWTWPVEAKPEDVVGEDFLFGNLCLYWFTATTGSAAFVGYAQNGWGGAPTDSGVPTAVIVFAHDVGVRRFAEEANTIVRWTDVDTGGHFAALEQPERLVDDISEFIRTLR